MGCNRLTKWWYLQVARRLDGRRGAVTGLQNGGIYKESAEHTTFLMAVKGLQNDVLPN